jgi:ceramide glucosyltransferase
MGDLFAALAIVGLVLVAVLGVFQRRLLTRPVPAPPAAWPAVSVLKPLRGVDPDLEANLASVFRQEYPDFEVLLGADDADDPALAIALRVAAAHPDVPSRIVADGHEVVLNPKVNNLVNLAAWSRHDVLFVSDANVRLAPGTLRELVARLEQPGVGLVSSPIRGPRGSSLGAALEGLQLNTFVMGGVAGAVGVGTPCVVGKSMLLRRATLERLGGWRALGRFLAEDQVCGEKVAAQGLALDVAATPIDNVLGAIPVRSFLARHLRWARIRFHMSPATYLVEPLLQPSLLALLAALVDPGLFTAVLLAGVVVLRGLLDAASERVAGTMRPVAAAVALATLRDLLVGVAWVVPVFSRTVSWRGNRFHVGRRTLLTPVTGPLLPPSQPEPAEV